jgi:peroxiredoxin
VYGPLEPITLNAEARRIMVRRLRWTAYLLAGCAAIGTASRPLQLHAQEKKGLEIGQLAPKWENLEGVDGKRHSLADLKEAKAVLVVFTCNHCPVAQAYEDRLIDLHAKYRQRGVELVAINVNNLEADRLPAMKERAAQKGFKFAYLYDPSQAIGRAYGATVTPHAFVLDGQRKLAYMGAIDDDMNAAKAETHYVRQALEAVLAGKQPEPAQTQPAGCGIVYE